MCEKCGKNHPTTKHYVDKKFNRDRGRQAALKKALMNCNRDREPVRWRRLNELVGR